MWCACVCRVRVTRLCCRYTSPAFKSLNYPLRTYKLDAAGKVLLPPAMAAPHNFPVTVFYIREAIAKLRAVESVMGTQVMVAE